MNKLLKNSYHLNISSSVTHFLCFMLFSLYNSLTMHVHYFHFIDEISWTQRYCIPKVNTPLISSRVGVHIQDSLDPESMPFTLTRTSSYMHGTPPQIEPILSTSRLHLHWPRKGYFWRDVKGWSKEKVLEIERTN